MRDRNGARIRVSGYGLWLLSHFSNRKASYPIARILNNHDGAFQEYLGSLGKNIEKCDCDKGRYLVMQPEDDDAGELVPTESEEITEVEVECQNDSLFLSRLPKDCGVRKTPEPFLSQVNDLVSLLAKRSHRAHRNTHIGQEPHWRDPAVG